MLRGGVSKSSLAVPAGTQTPLVKEAEVPSTVNNNSMQHDPVVPHYVFLSVDPIPHSEPFKSVPFPLTALNNAKINANFIFIC